MARYLGKETTRVDGLAKVTGKAKYTAEFQIPNVSYGFIVLSTVAKGRITAIDTREAEQAGGVIRVFTHLNAGKLGPAPEPARRRHGPGRCNRTGCSSTANRSRWSLPRATNRHGTRRGW
jgi:CO/xanthine dehydrogenase Mo-binding subunit